MATRTRKPKISTMEVTGMSTEISWQDAVEVVPDTEPGAYPTDTENTEATEDVAEAEAEAQAQDNAEEVASPLLDLASLSTDDRKTLIAALVEKARADRAAARESRKAAKEARTSTKVDNSAQDADVLTDVVTKVAKTPVITTESAPNGFHRYTGTVTVPVGEAEDGTQITDTFHATITMRKARRNR